MSAIQKFYKGKNVFLTGGTGFLGKLLIQKLLKSTEVNTIYLMVRPKRGIGVEERTRQLLEHSIFSEVRDKIDKIKTFTGDLNKLNLDLSDEDRETLNENVNIIIHCGAYLNMVSNLGESVFSNVRSTREILVVAKNCKKLVSFVYVSTAYSNCPKTVIEEKFFDSPINPDLLIKMSEEIDDETLERISSGLRGAWPNNYSFTKAVSEGLVHDAIGTIPIGLVRPSVVTPTAEEPIKGWTDNLYGPVGFLLSINMGILRTIRIQASVKLDMVPADKVINAILCTAWEVDQQWKKVKGINYVPPIINFSGKDSRIYVDFRCLRDKTMIALKSAIWYPSCLFVSNQILFIFMDKLLHSMPYYTMDMFDILRGKKPRASRLYKKVGNACTAMYFFMTREWTIQNDNTMALWNKLSDEDKRIYNFDVTSIHPEEYFQSFAVGLKQYLVKEDMCDIAQHEKRRSLLKMLHFFTVGLAMVFILTLLKYIVSSIVL